LERVDPQEEQTPLRGVEGYYSRFFVEEKRLGMGAEGSVFLCQHVLEGNPLGHYAVKKIAVGSSSPYLFKMLREVRLLETLRHPNIIPYHHVWIETTKFSSFGPPIAALHILMMYANSGNLDTFIASRSSPSEPDDTFLEHKADSSSPPLDAAELKRRFKSRRASSMAAQHVGGGMERPKWERRETRAVMLFSKEEVQSLFGDVASGLAFLHANSILHLDLKCSNVLLHMRDGQLIPTAMISDFGTSEEMLHQKRDRTGHTGTMEYMAPETVLPDAEGHFRQTDSTADMWSLGLILHKMLFFRLPYDHDDTFSELERQIASYRGFTATPSIMAACERRGLPRQLLSLLEKLVSLTPSRRPSAEKVVKAWTEMDFARPGPTYVESQLQVGLATNPTVRSPSWVRQPSSPPRHIRTITGAPASPPLEVLPRSVMKRTMRRMGDRVLVRQRRTFVTAFKVLIAVGKIASLIARYPTHGTRYTATLYLGITLAVWDMTQEEHAISLFLLVAHAALYLGLGSMPSPPASLNMRDRGY